MEKRVANLQHSNFFLTTESDELQYRKPIGTHKPSFQGIPQDYYPLSFPQVIAYALYVILSVSGVLAIMVAFLQWVLASGLEAFIEIWSITFLLFIITLIVAFYVGGVKRVKEEKRVVGKKHQALLEASKAKKQEFS